MLEEIVLKIVNCVRFLCLLLVVTGCGITPPKVAPRQPWFVTESNLSKKAEAHYKSTSSMVTDQGLLLYSCFKPFSNEVNYHDSHDIADQPAWHGIYMASLALEQAVSGKDRNKDLGHLADGLLSYYKTTGQEGLLGRSAIPDYKGQRLSWMDTKKSRPTKYWTNQPNGVWWRNGLAKGHLAMACFGSSVPLALDRKGEIKLDDAVKKKLIAVLLPAVRRLIVNDYRIKDYDGKFTEFGDLRPFVALGPNYDEIKILPNGFNQCVVLAMLKSASYYDAGIAQLYHKERKKWSFGIKSMSVVGDVIGSVGHHRIGKPSYSDMQLFGLSSFVYLLQEDKNTLGKDVVKGMAGLWKFMKFERNPSFTLPYYYAAPHKVGAHRINEIITDLADFPMPKDKVAFAAYKKDTDKVQPLCNRTTNSHYWKSSPFRKQTGHEGKTKHPKTGSHKFYSGQDYLLAYWLGRYLQAVPKVSGLWGTEKK